MTLQCVEVITERYLTRLSRENPKRRSHHVSAQEKHRHGVHISTSCTQGAGAREERVRKKDEKGGEFISTSVC